VSQRALAKDLAREILVTAAPERAGQIDEIEEAFVADPRGMLTASKQGDALNIGGLLIVGVGALAMVVSQKVVEYYVEVVLKQAHSRWPTLRRPRPAELSADELRSAVLQEPDAAREYVQRGVAQFGEKAMVMQLFDVLLETMGRQTPSQE
jgi:hypothetical protein